MKISTVAALATGLPFAVGHIAMWDPAMYGWKDDQPNQSDAHLPLMHMNFNEWWFHGPGFINHPPAPGVFMELPAGGTYHGQVSCNKAMTTYGPLPAQLCEYACDNTGSMHTTDAYASPNPVNVKGCGLGIAYKSNIRDIQPEDITVISTNYQCPWKRQVDFQIPADLPECPPEGCTCMWGWVHASDAGSQQIYMLGYRCKVTGATNTIPLPPPQIARKCPVDKSNCTVGSKQPHYWLQNERNNNYQHWDDAPFYNGDYGFANGAQTDLYAAVGGVAVNNPSNPPSNPSNPPAQAPSSSTTTTSEVPTSAAPSPTPDVPVPISISVSAQASASASTPSSRVNGKHCRRRVSRFGDKKRRLARVP